MPMLGWRLCIVVIAAYNSCIWCAFRKNNQVDIDIPKVEVSINDTVDISDTNGKCVVLHSYTRLWTGNNLTAALRFGYDLNNNVDTSNKDGDLCSYGNIIQDSVHYEEKEEPGLDFSKSPISNCYDIGRITTCKNDTLNPRHYRSCSSLSGISAADIDSDDSVPFSDCPSEDEEKYRRDDPNSPTPSTKKFKTFS